jgi:hypothetical protein
MNGLRHTDIAQRDNEFMDLTSLTQDEFAELLPFFEEAFQKRMRCKLNMSTAVSNGVAC